MPPTPLTVQYKEIDGSKIDADIYLPPRAATDNGQVKEYPVLIDIHGGSFMLGHSKMVCMPQVDDCLARGWIVVSPNHRLCPQVNILEGPMADCRDLLAWIYDGHLDAFLAGESAAHVPGSQYRVDKDRVMAFGTSSGGTLALSLGWDVPRRVAAILDFYAPAYLTHPFWTQPLPEVASKLPPLDPAFLNRIYDERPVPTNSSISLEGQTEVGVVPGPDFSRPRDGFALTQVANGTVIQACYPGQDVKEIDPVHHIDAQFPPTCIVHGGADTKVTIDVSRELFRVLKEQGVRCEMIEVPGEDHTFAMSMKVGSQTWELQKRGFDFLEGVIASR
ncbi:alpha/beta-hydrolase [Aspergillus japonicus CBS 114.51]|uniref:Alpha/beta-hydrolase n=2 Tax=Aspergillus TaxID=5052 RepID=A0A2V5H2N6_ASPV1|nr:alpha/beta-hydrolase [Aspergillus japonicus CBS 114.51]PYI18198.1 alpha/beta-hydrolase [Aspergillus violaceofuscus CBS 115571]RAH81381.1 alpha/beta-hydrolase [Aspergillus japonicus CBS 114.51]